MPGSRASAAATPSSVVAGLPNDEHLGAPRAQRLDQHGGLLLGVEAHPDPAARQRPLVLERRAQAAEERHVLPRPRHAAGAFAGEGRICEDVRRGLHGRRVFRKCHDFV